jgi:PEP-CTERM motif
MQMKMMLLVASALSTSPVLAAVTPISGMVQRQAVAWLDDGALTTVGPLSTASWNLEPQTGAVPEPASWAMLITGFGIIGATMRRRRQAAQPSRVTA